MSNTAWTFIKAAAKPAQHKSSGANAKPGTRWHEAIKNATTEENAFCLGVVPPSLLALLLIRLSPGLWVVVHVARMDSRLNDSSKCKFCSTPHSDLPEKHRLRDTNQTEAYRIWGSTSIRAHHHANLNDNKRSSKTEPNTTATNTHTTRLVVDNKTRPRKGPRGRWNRHNRRQ